MKRFSIIKNSHLWLVVGGLLLVGAWVSFFSNIRFSEEFTGGVKITIDGTFDQAKASQDILQYMTSKGYVENRVSFNESDNKTSLSIVTDVQSDEKVNELSKDIQSFLVQSKLILSSDKIIEQSITGPSVGDYMKSTAVKALIIGLAFIVVYMMFAFATIRKYVSPSTLALVTIGTMIFDVSIPAGAYGLLMMFNHTATIDTIFIIAILTNMGYSINDTIIVFDRLRENMQLNGHQKGLVYGKLFEDSIWQTMRRSIGTVLSTFLVIVAMFIFGHGVIKDFAFTIGIGVLAGSYSSIFISGPLAYLLLGKYSKEKSQL